MKNKKNTLSAKSHLEKLKAKLAEHENIIHAIQTGQVDALMVKNKKGEINVIPLQGSEFLYETLIESMNEGAITINTIGEILYCNNKFARMINVLQSKVIGTQIFMYVPENQKSRLKNYIKNFAKKDNKVFSLIASDTSIKTVHLSCQELQLNNIPIISIVITDISILEQAERRYSTLMENVNCGIIMHDYQGIVTQVNKQTEIIFARKKNQLVGFDIRNFLIPKEKPAASVVIARVIKEKTINSVETRIVRPDGKIRNVLYSATLAKVDSGDLILGVINDVTELYALRRQNLLSDKLATIGMLAAGLVHEINNPMTWIVTNLSYIKREFNKITFDNLAQQKLKIDEAVDDSLQGCNKILDIVSNLKGFVRVSCNKPIPVNINELIESVIKMVSLQFKNITSIKTELSQSIPQLILNQNQLHQVLLNLIVNAAQSMEETNSDKNMITIQTVLEKNDICINIADTGKGIVDDIKDKIFEPFFTTKPIGIGTGLGLSLCADIINGFGGTISLTSTLDKGTTFSVRLPLKLKLDAANKNQALDNVE
jgi:PAS domain S-box-containing protein